MDTDINTSLDGDMDVILDLFAAIDRCRLLVDTDTGMDTNTVADADKDGHIDVEKVYMHRMYICMCICV